MASSGNFCVMNPLLALDDSGNKGITFTKGNLRGQNTVNGIQTMGTMAVKSGKWYYEERYDADANISDARLQVGVQALGDFSGLYDGEIYTASRSTSARVQGTHIYYLRPNYQGGKLSHPTSLNWDYGNNDSGSSNDGIRVNAVGDIYMIALDLDNYKFYIGRNGTWYSNNVAGATGSNTDITQVDGWSIESTWQGSFWTPVLWIAGASSGTAGYFNFGQDSTFGGQITAGGNQDSNGFGDFKYSVPSGYQAWTSANLPISADIDPAQTSDDIPTKQFGAYTYTGSNGSAVTVSTDFKADLIWIKSRSSTDNHYLQDSNRGFGNSKSISSNSDSQQGYNGGAPSSSGAQNVGSSSFQAYGSDWSRDTDNMIAWCWRANGGVTSSNTDGSITSTVQANTKSGFSIITWTASGSNGSIGHGLSAKPDFHIIKKRNSSSGWIVYHTSLGATKFLRLDETGSASSNQYLYNNTEPTSTVINLGDNGGTNHPSGDSYICYAWHSVEGFSSFGKWVANGQSSGAFIQTGFRPRLLFIKGDNSGDWVVIDTARATYNPTNNASAWNLNNGDQTSGRELDILSNGFKVRTSNSNLNSDGTTYFYGAWGDVPFKYNNTF